jgi:hypothetical protein
MLGCGVWGGRCASLVFFRVKGGDGGRFAPLRSNLTPLSLHPLGLAAPGAYDPVLTGKAVLPSVGARILLPGYLGPCTDQHNAQHTITPTNG